MYVVFKCFMLHVFLLFRESGGVGEWDAVSQWSADMACGALGPAVGGTTEQWCACEGGANGWG
jgi:hypothetical protein